MGCFVRHCTSQPLDSSWLPGDRLRGAHGVGPLQPEFEVWFRNEASLHFDVARFLVLSPQVFPMDKVDVLSKLAERFARQDICSVILEVRGVCLREKFESSLKIGEKVFCRIETNAHAKLGKCIAVHRADDGELAGRVAAEQGDLLVPFLRKGDFFLYHW